MLGSQPYRSVYSSWLKTQPERSGVPLAYIIREDDNQLDAPQELLDNYIHKAPLEGEIYALDARSVRWFLMKLICGNKVEEAQRFCCL